MKAIVTNYSLTYGPKLVDGEVSTETPSMFCDRALYGTYYHGHGKNWHTDKESAKAKIRVMGAARRKTLQKALAQLDSKIEKALAAVDKMEL